MTSVRGEASHHGNYSIHIVKRASKAHYFTHHHSSHPRRVRNRVLLECRFSRNIKFQWPVFGIHGILLQKYQSNMEIFDVVMVCLQPLVEKCQKIHEHVKIGMSIGGD